MFLIGAHLFMFDPVTLATLAELPLPVRGASPRAGPNDQLADGLMALGWLMRPRRGESAMKPSSRTRSAGGDDGCVTQRDA